MEIGDVQKECPMPKTLKTLEEVAIDGFQPIFDKLPIELLNEIFSYLDTESLNRIRKVQYDWNNLIKNAFGIKIILNNRNIEDMSVAQSVREIQVRNLTRRLANSPLFLDTSKLSGLEIMGMILSANLIQLLTESFENLKTLKLSRIYLETDRRLLISSSTQRKFPTCLKHIRMRFLKTFHKDLIHINHHRSSDLFKLTPSDNIVLHILNEFCFPELEILELYHDLEADDDLKMYRNSEIIQSSSTEDVESDSISTQLISTIVGKALNPNLKKILVDNSPYPNWPDMDAARNEIQLRHVDIKSFGTGSWSTLLEGQSCLRSLSVVLMDKNLLRGIVSVVKRNPALESIAIVVSTPNNVTLEDSQNASDLFDLAFFNRFNYLRTLKFHFPPKIVDVTVLPKSLTSLDLCAGNVYGILEFLKESHSLESLSTEVCSGRLENNAAYEGSILFTKPVLRELVASSSTLTKAVIVEAGAKAEFQDFMDDECNKNKGIIQAELDSLQYRNPAQALDAGALRAQLVNVPRIKLKISRNRKVEQMVVE